MLTDQELELDGLREEVRDYKAAVRFMHLIHKQQMEKYHKHLRRDHQDPKHRMAWKFCLGLPCVIEREELLKVEQVMWRYGKAGDPLGSPNGAN